MDINRLINLGTSHAERARTYPQAPIDPWNKENQKRWAGEFHRLLALASAGSFSETLDALHEGLGQYRDDRK